VCVWGEIECGLEFPFVLKLFAREQGGIGDLCGECAADGGFVAGRGWKGKPERVGPVKFVTDGCVCCGECWGFDIGVVQQDAWGGGLSSCEGDAESRFDDLQYGRFVHCGAFEPNAGGESGWMVRVIEEVALYVVDVCGCWLDAFGDE
jgi:hypothetical protein